MDDGQGLSRKISAVHNWEFEMVLAFDVFTYVGHMFANQMSLFNILLSTMNDVFSDCASNVCYAIAYIGKNLSFAFANV